MSSHCFVPRWVVALGLLLTYVVGLIIDILVLVGIRSIPKVVMSHNVFVIDVFQLEMVILECPKACALPNNSNTCRDYDKPNQTTPWVCAEKVTPQIGGFPIRNFRQVGYSSLMLHSNKFI